MEALLLIWVAIMALVAMAAGQNLIPSNWTSAEATKQNDDAIDIQVSVGSKMVTLGPVLGLTSKAKKDIPAPGLSGPAYHLKIPSYATLSSDNIALISCDKYPGELQAGTLFGTAEGANVTAIVLYSEISDWCNLQDYWEKDPPRVYTTKSGSEATQLLKAVNTPDPNKDGQVYVRIRNHTASNGNSDSSNNHSHDYNPLGPSPSTAVAMIILYSITGIITALFLVIIVTGALRAHRHPERYGPRTIAGRPRQSRARGLARAIVETLPIVKFGEPEPPKPTDIELADQSTNRDGTERNITGTEGTNNQPQQIQADPPSQPRQSVEGGIAAAINGDRSTCVADTPENLSCSICTDEFEAGQDQRVLPCDHRFHPDCIDPWLLNVSGTCPMCRIDLRPRTSSTTEAGEVDENGNPVLREGEFSNDMAPPLGPHETAGERQRMSIRRSIIIGLMGVGRPDRMTREERVLALRHLRGQHLARQRREQQASVTETPEEERSTRTRLRSIFGVRTRRTGQADEQAPPNATTEEPESRREDTSAP